MGELRARLIEMIAFKKTSKAYPNYGKKTDMGARQWWTEVCDCSIFLSDFLFHSTSFSPNDPIFTKQYPY
jgi:hypothetical protein